MKVAWNKEKPPTEVEIRAYCAQWGDVIFVREKLEGKWSARSLNELPADLREKWIQTFINRQFIPHRIA